MNTPQYGQSPYLNMNAGMPPVFAPPQQQPHLAHAQAPGIQNGHPFVQAHAQQPYHPQPTVQPLGAPTVAPGYGVPPAPFDDSLLGGDPHLPQATTPTPGLTQAATVDMVWFTFQAASFLTCLGYLLEYDPTNPIIYTAVYFVCFCFAWKAYHISTGASNSSKLSFFKCYKIFRMVVMVFCIVEAAASVYNTFGKKYLYGPFQLSLVGIHTFLTLAAAYAICRTDNNIKSDLTLLETA